MSINKQLSINDQYEITLKNKNLTVIEECRSSMRYDTNFLIAVKVKIKDKECWITREIYKNLFEKKEIKNE